MNTNIKLNERLAVLSTLDPASVGPGTVLTAWVSAEYLSESTRATKRDCPPPWMHEDEVKDAPTRAAEDLRASIRALAVL